MPLFRRFLVPLALLLLAGPILTPTRLAAQDPDPPKEEDGGDPDADKYNSDPGSDVDPSLIDVEASTLGLDVEPYTGDPDLLSTTEDPYDLGGPPPPETLAPVAAARDCATYTLPVTPIAVDGTIQHYFVKDGGPRILAGSSADVGCHLYLPDKLKCRYGSITATGAASPNGRNLEAVLDDAATRGFNKVRVWVAMVNETLPENVPFARVNGYWDLNTKNEAYFNRLLEVVNYAHERGHVVEVTFFVPYQGATFAQGAWVRAPRGGTTQIGFSKEQAFVVANDGRLAQSDRDMLVYQKNVIDWTVKKLACYDNLIWEIANEPGAQGNDGVIGDPAAVAAWQKQMILYVRAAEGSRPKHSIAVQPFSATELGQFTGSDRPAGVINGHYATLAAKTFSTFPAGQATLDRGAIDTIRGISNLPIVVGFNETKITPFGGEAGTRSHLNGVVGSNQLGVMEPPRAEAIEFLFNQGSIYEHWGYLGKPGTNPAAPYSASPMRAYISKLLGFFNTRRFDLPHALNDYKTMSLKPSAADWGAWFRPGDYAAWEPTTGSRKHWAALTTKPGISPRSLLYYVHHSTPRCKEGFDYFSYLNRSPRCQSLDADGAVVTGNLLVFNSYDSRIWTSTGTKYQEHLPILAPGTYEVTWIDPETLQPFAGTTTQTVNCSGCTLDSPLYKFDLIVKLVKR